MSMRLDKLLAHSGYGSRKEVKELIRKGYVSVNNEIIYDDDYKVNEELDEIIIDEMNVSYQKLVYLLLNKPAGVVSATFDNYHQTVIDLVAEYRHQGVFPVGRLDIDTEGLLLITNDGNLAHNLLSPKKHVDKTYYVEFTGTFEPIFYARFKEGIFLEDGYQTLPAQIEVLTPNTAHVTIHEGKFHQVKRMFLALGMEVVYLKRISFGTLQLEENLALGEYRQLTKKELDELKNR